MASQTKTIVDPTTGDLLVCINATKYAKECIKIAKMQAPDEFPDALSPSKMKKYAAEIASDSEVAFTHVEESELASRLQTAGGKEVRRILTK